MPMIWTRQEKLLLNEKGTVLNLRKRKEKSYADIMIYKKKNEYPIFHISFIPVNCFNCSILSSLPHVLMLRKNNDKISFK